MQCKFIKDSTYWGEGIPCEIDEAVLSEEDMDDDELVDAYIEKRREDYRRAFGSYIREHEEVERPLRYQDILV